MTGPEGRTPPMGVRRGPECRTPSRMSQIFTYGNFFMNIDI
jgi:hypothetical protein